MSADVHLALTVQVTITVGGQVLPENWALLKNFERDAQILRCPKSLTQSQREILPLSQVFHSFFLVCVFSCLL